MMFTPFFHVSTSIGLGANVMFNKRHLQEAVDLLFSTDDCRWIDEKLIQPSKVFVVLVKEQENSSSIRLKSIRYILKTLFLEYNSLMALAAQQSLLDELMGKGRNAGKGEHIQRSRFDDPDVCKLMLVDYCPHELFINTRQNLGFCDKSHESHLQKEYQSSSRYRKLGYEEEFGIKRKDRVRLLQYHVVFSEHYLQSLIADVERRIKRGQERLRLTQGEPNSENDPFRFRNELISKIKEISDEITSYVLKSEELGNACQIDEAQHVLSQCEELREQKNNLELQLNEEIVRTESNKSMEVCSVCGSFLVIGDIQSRVDEHNSGKQHAGYAKIRATLEAIAKRKSEALEKERTESSQKQETSSRKRNRLKSQDIKSNRRHSPSPPSHRHHSSREKPAHHYHHKHRRSSPTDHRRHRQ
ncbi:unnamed protein product [Adineta ricciae]|uniref:Luc7-like protein 3 n=1 Tax=Adineta ricciae TaxID=249248 RepID=A0A814YCA4_ADIRI|nr:unnamed protein product [Adineta ricciae]